LLDGEQVDLKILVARMTFTIHIKVSLENLG